MHSQIDGENLQKELRQISIENLQEIGRGSEGSVYKLDDKKVLKVFHENWTQEKVSLVYENSRKAFFSGLDTAMTYDVVRVGKNFGIVYEKLNTTTLDKVIFRKPVQIEFYAKKFANFVKHVHEVEFDGISSKQEQSQ